MTLSDDVWQQLDHHAGRLSRRTFWPLTTGLIVLIGLAAATVVSWRTVANPFDSDVASFSASTSPSPMRFDVTFEVRNAGLVPITIGGVGRDGEALTLLDAWATPARVQPGDTTTIHVEYAVADCRDYEHGSWPVPVRLDRPWGTQTVYVTPPALANPDAPSSYQFTGDQDPYAVDWQESFVRQVCAPASQR